MKKRLVTLATLLLSLILIQPSFAMGGGGHSMGDSSSDQMHEQANDQMHEQQSYENHNTVHTNQKKENVTQPYMDTDDQYHMDNDTHKLNSAPNNHQQNRPNSSD